MSSTVMIGTLISSTGKERDSESGLDYFGARYYGSALGRFTSPDKPLLDQFPENPQSWNLYAYGRNNPLNGTDPSGESWSEFWQAFGNCFRYGSCHTTDHIADQRENGFLSSLQVDGKYLSPSQQEDLKARLFGGLSSANAIGKVDALNGAIPHVQQNDDTGVPPLPGQLGQPAQRARYEDPGHHDPSSPNYIRGKSPIPDDAADVYNNAIRRGDPKPGEGEVYYGKNANGEYYRYSGQNGTVHWSGSVLKEQVPNWIRKALN